MAKVICENCGRTIRDSDLRCLYCNAINVHRKRDVDDTSSFFDNEKTLYESSFSNGFSDAKEDIVSPPNEMVAQETVCATELQKANVSTLERYNSIESLRGQSTAKRQTQEAAIIGPISHSGGFFKNKVVAVIIGIILIIFLLAIGGILYEEIDFMIWDAQNLDEGYYINNKQLYFYDSSVYDDINDIELSRWWKYDIAAQDWTIYQECPADEMTPIFGFTDDDAMWEYEVEQIFGLDEDLINIRLSKTYIDAGHHYRPRHGYYLYDNLAYYYLDDFYAWDEEISGWYRYNPDQGAWLFYCTYENKDFLGDVLYYYPETVFVGDSDASWRTTGFTPPLSFHETEWYKLYQAHEAELREKYD